MVLVRPGSIPMKTPPITPSRTAINIAGCMAVRKPMVIPSSIAGVLSEGHQVAIKVERAVWWRHT